MKDCSICAKCLSAQENTVGKKCQACIGNNMFEEKRISVINQEKK